MSYAPRGSSLNPSPAPGSFSSNLRSQLAPSRTGSSQDVNANASIANLERLDEDDGAVPGQVLAALRESLNREMKIKEGSENMLEALNTKKAKQTKEQRLRVEAELTSSNQKIKALRSEISELQRPKVPSTPTRSRMDTLFQSNGLRSPPSAARSAGSDYDEPQESPTYALAEILQALEIEGLTPDYYVGHANNLVELFKRYPPLKYDLVWSVFGLRMQVMLLSESREVVAAGYRMTRYAISDIMVLSLIKKSNADVEREQALKFVRAFLDVKDGIQEVSRAVVRTIASVAEHAEDRLRSICIETLGEMMVRDPGLLVISGGLRPLADALGEGTYEASESLTAAFLFLLDAPQRRNVGDSKWAIQLLVTQLYDPEVEVCATAIKILEEACNRKNYLEYIVQCRPALDHLGEIGAPLLLRFLSTSIGYHYLDGLDYISNEMDDWFLGRNDSYVGVIEASLARAFVEMPEETSNRMSVDEDTFELDADNDGHVPPHFYRELTRTKEGCKLLRDKGHFEEFASTIRDYGMLSDDPETILKVKGCLWAVGNVGSMELGAPFLEESDAVENIVRIAESHEVMSLRGTAFFVLGLISRSVHGLEIMSEFGWDSNTTTMGASLGLCIPQNLSKFFSYQTWSHEKASEITASGEQRAAIMAAKTDDDFVSNRILELVIDLGNTVLQKRAMTELMHIKSKKLPNFSHPALFRKVMTLLESSHFRINVRRFVIELFERSVLRRIVFEEESDDEDMDSDDDSGNEGRTERQRSISDLSYELRS
ncbi:Target of rapamycin complex 2 subunit [Lachnellula willkommii]|uniref:Target of rapamycin complex 2 subunit n=1 Tax=Lachnellula willkommii TaxID=215461 RepID=A0A559MGQ7_9HELO|nr:Target of rapamycin complex 2 subunit [Lachnellula willkommii]